MWATLFHYQVIEKEEENNIQYNTTKWKAVAVFRVVHTETISGMLFVNRIWKVCPEGMHWYWTVKEKKLKFCYLTPVYMPVTMKTMYVYVCVYVFMH